MKRDDPAAALDYFKNHPVKGFLSARFKGDECLPDVQAAIQAFKMVRFRHLDIKRAQLSIRSKNNLIGSYR